MACVYVVFLLFFVSFEAVGAQEEPPAGFIPLESATLSPTIQPTSWTSPSGLFAFGFYPQGSDFLLGIWLMDEEKTLVWTAHRDDPPVPFNAKLLTINGKLLLRTGQSEEKVIVESASFAFMRDSGNFMVYNQSFHVIWENALPMALDAYWASGTWEGGTVSVIQMYLNDTTGELVLRNSTNLGTRKVLYTSSRSAKNTIYSARLSYDGMFRVYSHGFDSNSNGDKSVLWSAVAECQVKGFCGLNSYCARNDSEPYCVCLPGTDFVDSNQKLLGCLKNFTEYSCNNISYSASYHIVRAEQNLQWDDLPYFKGTMSMEECMNGCLEDCNCEVALYKDGYCSKRALPLKYARSDENVLSAAFFKMGKKSIEIKNNTSFIPDHTTEVTTTSTKDLVLILVITVGFITCSFVSLAISGFFIFKFRVAKYRRLLEDGKRGLMEELKMQSFSYKELQKASRNFKEELGKGAFGTVYLGVLHKGKKLVAIKRLEKMVEEGEREFRAEMRAIGRTHHKNLVRLLGYCTEGSKRLLVYEYMSNRSLADILFKSKTRPPWDERVRIALDVARGILYLHEECEAPIIHCDIKPQNILMDDFWTAKISDFGLAKLLMPDQTRTFTGVRGTRGYLAPEWQQNIPISVKADVYSYGIVLLELVCCRRNLEVNVSEPEEIVLSNWAYKCFVAGELHKLLGGEEVERKSLEQMVKLGLWCIQDEPALRPSIKSIVLMLEGITEIAVPPCPTTTSM
ncbi:G-type lectin S-receptor-like serine/threonine-protein kinase LECRK4 [Vitis vinifera]|uniref:non-specific serine/threonine protein kinase n=1 Tax=Vitis vinifera TaxID=29760 RepID=A0A438D1B9_VITVI|nr:G-type lectin S-receptor-like serine/threonine-protein kinase LECRK4 [Vitis vinifera]